jgi:uncharacterized protein YkwD
MRKKHIFSLLAGVSLLVTASPALAGTSSVSNLLAAVDAARTSHGLRPVHLSPVLARAARSHSTDMLQHDYFAHGDFGGRMASFRVPGPTIGENLAWGTGRYGEAPSIVQEWLASPEHRANLLRPGYSRIGFGIARGTFLGSGGATVVTADFAGA